MCGICGYFHYNEDGDKILRQMTATLSPRGPDENGIYKNDEIAFGHRRLSVIDLKGGGQPMSSNDGRFVIVINGEIYNYRELRAELELKGSKFKSSSDTETVIEAVRHYGIRDALLKFRGMFAFALYDNLEKTLYFARDRVGIKPLYYSQAGKSIFFASEQKALLEVPHISRKMDYEGIYDFLTLGYPLTQRTCWKGIKMFPPGHYAVIKQDGKFELTPYWKWKWRREEMDFEEALEQTVRTINDSLQYNLVSDVPVAAFLSGGIDSSLLVYYMSQNGKMSERLKTFNVGFEEQKYNESEDAMHVAMLCGTDHYSIFMRKKDLTPELFEKVLVQYDEPFGDSSCIPTYLICREMAKHAKVVISGDGGDEMFGGYNRFYDIASLQKLSRMLPMKKTLSSLFPMLLHFLGDDSSRRLSKALKYSMMPEKRLFCELHTYYSEEEKRTVLTDYMLEQTGGFRPTWEKFADFLPCNGNNITEDLIGLELMIHLHGDYLRKVDVASSAHGLEVRVPFLDNAMLDFSSRLPLEHKLRKGECKYILREIARRNLSRQTGDKKKQGFGMPFDILSSEKMRGYIKDILLGEKAAAGLHRIVKKEEIKDVWSKFTDENANRRALSRYQVYQRVFMLAAIQIWINKHKAEF